MKKSVTYVFTILLALNSCSMEDNEQDMLKEIYKEWGITISYQDVFNSETYYLLENLLDSLNENLLLPQPVHSSYMPTLFPTEMNNYLRNSNEAAVFFDREEDCISVLISTYLTNLKTAYNMSYLDYEDLKNHRKFNFFEMLLSSEMLLSKMSSTEKVQLMVLAFERAKYTKFCSPHPFTIMISIMLSSNYLPFINDIVPMIIECSPCIYCLKMNNDTLLPGSSENKHSQATDLIKRYAKQFIKDNK